MRFAHPIFILLFLLIPVLLSFFLYQRKKDKRLWTSFASDDFRTRLLPFESNPRKRFKKILRIFVLVFIVIALIEPQWGSREEEVKMRGVNVMLLVDVSHSMLASDLKPNRLALEKRKVRDLVNMLSGDRIGLVAFAGRSFLLSPLTADYGTLERYVEELGPETIPVPGTDLAGAINLALKSFPEGDEGKAIMVFTDGEDHSEKMKIVLKKLKKAKVPVFILGIGTPDGAPVPEPGGGFKSNLAGQTVVSKLKEDFLKDFALKTGGAYVRVVSGDEDLKGLYIKGIRGALSASDLRVSRKQVWESRFYWPLGIGLGLLSLEGLISSHRRRKQT